MSAEENRAVIMRLFEVWSTGELRPLAEIIAPDYVGHFMSSTVQPASGPEWYRQYVTIYRAQYPDLHITIEDQLTDGDKGGVRWTLSGTHRGETRTSLGITIPPTGRRINITGVILFRLANGKIAEEWWEYDRLGLLMQLGAIPAPTQELASTEPASTSETQWRD